MRILSACLLATMMAGCCCVAGGTAEATPPAPADLPGSTVRGPAPATSAAALAGHRRTAL